MITAEIREHAVSRAWAGPAPAISVVISTHNRAALIDGCLDALEAQTGVEAEVVVADNGSADDTWSRLAARCDATPLRLTAIRLDPHNGPGVPRNTAVAHTRSGLLAFTDDDCLPEPEWLANVRAAFDDPDTLLVQGRTMPAEGTWAGPWARTVEVTSLSGLYETANLAVRRTAFEAVSGFAADRRLTGRAFGEDVVLGTAIARMGRVRFSGEAVVRHRMMPAGYREHLEERLRLRGFPALAREVPELADRMPCLVFLSRRTATTDAAIAGLAVALVTRDRWPLLAAVPWLRVIWREAAGRPGRPRALRAAQLAAADLVGFAALVAGSASSRHVIL